MNHCENNGRHIERRVATVKNVALTAAATAFAVLCILLTLILRQPVPEVVEPIPTPIPVPGEPINWDAQPAIEELPGKPVPVTAFDPGPSRIDRPNEQLGGWAGREELDRALEALGKRIEPRLRIYRTSTPGDERTELAPTNEPAKLWEFYQAVNGKPPSPYRQERGDCVANATCNAIRIRMCGRILAGAEQEFREPYRPYTYLISRHFNGTGAQFGCARGRNGHGSLVSYALAASQTHGVLAVDSPGLPPYSGNIVDQFSCPRTTPNMEQWISLAKENLVGECARLRNAEEVQLALQQGYPVPCGFGVAFRMTGQVRDVNGKQKLVGVQVGGSWGHAECILAYEDDLFFLWNSWGADAHGRQPDDSPSGGFWITRRAVNDICRVGEALAVSEPGGFRPLPFDLDSLRLKHKEVHRAPREIPEPSAN